MRRKYDLRNKRNFLVILVLSVAIICIFSLFIYKYRKASKIMYPVDAGSIVQDTDKNFIDITEDAVLRIRWNGNYYLIYQDKKVSLGKKVVIYNTLTGSLKLYGKFYEIKENGEVVLNKDETVLNNTTDSKFYKIDDREYLLVDRQIFTDDRNTQANDYLLVELDKIGNAKLSNFKLNLKTIAPTKLITSKYVFDIANEILKYSKRDIDLKKIIGTTNEYKEEKKEEDAGTLINGNGTDVAGGGNGRVNNNGVINSNDNGEETNIDEMMDKTKTTAIIKPVASINKIDVDYVVYDPYNEYKTVYAEILKAGRVEVVYLSKSDTHVVFDNLNANTEYKINFMYTVINSETGDVVPTKFDEITVKTLMPTYQIAVEKISKFTNTVLYKVNIDPEYRIKKINVTLSFDYRVVSPETGDVQVRHADIPASISLNGSERVAKGSIDITGYDIDKGTFIELTLDSVSSSTGVLNIPNVHDTFRF